MRDASLLVIVVASFATACTLLVSTSDLSGEDAGAPGPLPVGSEAGANTGDASTDSGPGFDAASGPCSAAGAVFCETFDAVDSTTKYVNTTDPTTSIATDDALFVSPPRSAKFTIAPSSNGSPDAVLDLRPQGSLNDFAIEAMLHIERSEPGGVARLMAVQPAGGEQLVIEHSGAVKSGTATTNIGAFAVGKWLPVRLEVHATPLPSRAALEVDGKRFDLNLAGAWVVAPMLVRIGVSEASSPMTGWIVRWDDVVVRKL